MSMLFFCVIYIEFRKMSEWNKLVKKTYDNMKKTDKNTSLKDALKAASKLYKKGGNCSAKIGGDCGVNANEGVQDRKKDEAESAQAMVGGKKQKKSYKKRSTSGGKTQKSKKNRKYKKLSDDMIDENDSIKPMYM